MNKVKSFFIEWIVPILIAYILALAINKFLIFKIKVPTSSMYPTIKPGDIILVTHTYHPEKLKRGSIVVFYSEEYGERLVKRLIGLPGDKIEIKNDGTVYINGKKYDEPYVKQKDKLPGNFTVPASHYFFLGDNRPDSSDSRYWQNPYIPAKDIEGRAFFTAFPFNRISVLK